MRLEQQRFHLLGIGGAGLSALAELLLARGAAVSGCDARATPVTDRLRARGAQVVTGGQDPAHVVGQDVLCYTTRLSPEGRAEVAAGEHAGLTVLDRPHLLASLIAGADAIGIAGTHGKTTTTAMVAHVLEVAGQHPSALIGDGASSRVGRPVPGRRDLLVAELDESDRTLPLHHPASALVTGVGFDHGDYYRDLADVRGIFTEFLGGLPPDGLAVLCADDEWLSAQPTPGHRRTYGWAPGANYRCHPDGSVVREGEGPLATLRLPIPGRHMLLDATGAFAVAVERGVAPGVVAAAFATFPGAKSRLERLGTWRGATLYDDYGHLPAQVGVTVDALRELPHERVVLVFQPHRYSRFSQTRDAMVPALRVADLALLTEIYGAGEDNPQGLSSAGLAAEAGCDFAPDLDAVRAWLEREVRGGDLVLLMGAGDLRRVGDALAQRV
ncbi:MAG: UDP-N-acetylmuramate--L-alanine ligase [Candidatus Dormiibacterota bacterium]